MMPSIRLLYFIALSVLTMFSLFGCFRNKPAKITVESWLETGFSGRFEVVHSNINLNVMDLYHGKKMAVIGEKADPEVQFLLHWTKGTDDLGLSKPEVEAACASAQEDVKNARALLRLLKDRSLESVSVGAIGPAAYILVFGPSDAATRERTLSTILAALDARPDPSQTSIWCEWMEEKAYKQQFQDIVPRGHWKISNNWQEDHKIMSLNFEWSKGLSVQILMKHWQINPGSLHSEEYREDAYKQALAWAEKKLPKPFYLEPQQFVAYEVDQNDGFAIRYSFPYFDAKPADGDSLSVDEPKGYVSGLYQTERKTCTNIKKQQTL